MLQLARCQKETKYSLRLAWADVTLGSVTYGYFTPTCKTHRKRVLETILSTSRMVVASLESKIRFLMSVQIHYSPSTGSNDLLAAPIHSKQGFVKL